MVYNNEWLSLTTIQGTIWLYAISPGGSGFQPLMYDFGWVLFLVLRIIPAYQLYRYYSGKTTRKLAYIATFIGDAIYILGGIVILLDAITHPGQFAIPLPFQMIFSILILWKIQGPEPTSPWKDSKKTSSWWKKSTVPPQEKPANDDELW